jgi:hypothetical protein
VPERVPVLAPLAGALAVAGSVIAFAMAAGGDAPLDALTVMTVVLGAGGGMTALLRPGRMWALALADALVATSVVASMFGLGLFELVPLMLLGAATIRTPHRPAALVATIVRPQAVPQPEPQRRTA